MGTNPGAGPPPPAAPSPTPPAPGAPREEWRAWRRQQRDYVRAQWRGAGWYGPWRSGGWFWGVALILAGVYFLLQNLGLLTWVRGDLLWPLLVILLGLSLLWRRGGWWP